MYSLIAVAVFIGLLYLLMKPRFTVIDHWHHFLNDTTLSSEEFYGKVREQLREMKLSALQVNNESFITSNIFSEMRLYLRISHEEYYFYVCAAPFATGTFVSWWLRTKNDTWANRIPVISKLLGNDRNNKTFYQVDTEIMYKSGVHAAVLSVLDEYSDTHGTRKLSELERQYKPSSK